jgi:hypothetical protein
MPERYATLLRQHEAALVRAFVDVIYTDRRTDLPALLSYHQLVDYLPEIFDELARILDVAALDSEIGEAVRPLRVHSQARFQQGCLIDEVARELIILRHVLIDFLWREEASPPRETSGNCAMRCGELIASSMSCWRRRYSFTPPVCARRCAHAPPTGRRRDAAAATFRKADK